MPNFWQLAITPILKIQYISFDYSWFLAKNLSNLVSLPWKLHNRYCHKLRPNLHFLSRRLTSDKFFTHLNGWKGIFCEMKKVILTFICTMPVWALTFALSYSMHYITVYISQIKANMLVFKEWCLRPVHVLLSRFYPDLILILSWFYPNFIQIKSG